MKTKLRRVFILLAVLCSISALNAQIPLNIHGYVNNLNNQPMAGKTVNIIVDSVFGVLLPFNYTSVVTTMPNGYYVDSVMLPAGAVSAMVTVWVFDCINTPHYQSTLYNSPAGLPSLNFNICDSNQLPPSCNAFFTSLASPNSLNVSFTDLSSPSTGNTISSWFWTFGDSAVSNIQNPTHTYTQSGSYNVCLTITDGANCANSYCQQIVVTGSAQGNCTAGFSAYTSPGTVNASFVNTSVSTYLPAIYTVSYVWDFGDSTTLTTTNMSAITHQYPQQGTYNVCLTIVVTNTVTNMLECQNTWCATVTVGSAPPNTGFLYGMLTSNNAPAGSSVVYLIDANPLLGVLTAVDTTISIDSSGITTYYFPNITPGAYLVKAAMLPANPLYASNMPTYHLSSLFWNQATFINVLPNAFTQASIDYIQGVNPGGPGFVGGLISQGANKGPGDPIEGVQVLLLDVNNGDEPMAVTWSDANGIFGFNNIPYGTYKVYAEVLNKTTNPVIVTIDANNPSTDAIKIVVGINIISFISETDNSLNGIVGEIYPNPVSEACFIPVKVEKSTTIHIEIFDLVGKAIISEYKSTDAGSSVIAIDTGRMVSGTHILVITTPGGDRAIRRLVKR